MNSSVNVELSVFITVCIVAYVNRGKFVLGQIAVHIETVKARLCAHFSSSNFICDFYKCIAKHMFSVCDILTTAAEYYKMPTANIEQRACTVCIH